MTRLFNDPASFAEEMVEGFVAASGRWVRAVDGGVVRSTQVAPGTVAVVIGGGSGHYPAFGGLVGQGLAHGAAIGNLFASPSSQQVYSVAAAAQTGGGVLLTYGNYAGDVLNFDLAQDRLRADGIDCRTVVVTDDISSASPAERGKRRGIAGDLAVFKVAGAAAEAGYSLADVTRVAAATNARTRSLGVAFTGCILPGASEPLFTVEQGRMAVGLGIHGEPGISEQDVPSADGLAELLVETLLREVPAEVQPAGGSHVAVVLNGLGSSKYEELFVVYRRVSRLLAAAGLEVVDPEVGELCTSFDMAGVSLTLCWLDEELERLWRAPADGAGYRKGSVPRAAAAGRVEVAPDGAHEVPRASEESRVAAGVVVDALAAVFTTIDHHAVELGRLDSVAGDGDHGLGMRRGALAALDAARAAQARGAGAGTVLDRAARAWAHRGGGTSGALWGLALGALAGHLGDVRVPRTADVSAGVADALRAVVRSGGAGVGDKTMVDALVPFSEVLDRETAAGTSLAAAWGAAAAAAQQAAEQTAALVPKLGRARPHAERSVGTADPGAMSLALVTRAVQDVLAERSPSVTTEERL
jgi:dihydroxyacetone kinase